MGAVSKYIERKLLNKLKRLFLGLINAITQGTGLIDGTERETKLIRNFVNSKEMTNYLNEAVGSMIHAVRKSSGQELKDDIIAQRGNRQLYKLVKNEMNGPLRDLVWEIMQDDVAYFKSLPEEWFEYAKKLALEEVMKGNRADDVAKELRKVLPEHVKTNLKLVTRTMCAKANAAIIQGRAQMCGINAYIWRSVTDERTRESHALMDGVIVYYNDPPSPEALAGKKDYGKYHAGNTYNCRCYQEPIVDYRFLPNIVRVYHKGKIYTMGKAQMESKFGKVA